MSVLLELPFYQRENLINYGLKKYWHLMNDTFILWIDSHQYFTNLYWWEESIRYMARDYAV